MSSKKDPAFLFYSKDWLEGMSEFLPEEKGVMIDLMAHQHQKKDLPTDTLRLARMVGLGHDEFLKIWDGIKDKYEPIDTPNGQRMVNRKLHLTMQERSEKGKRNTIIGIFASLLRKSDLGKKQYSEVKSLFKVDEFTNTPTERLTERITEWYQLCLKSIGNGNEDGNESIKDKGGVGEKLSSEKEVPELTEFLSYCKTIEDFDYPSFEFSLKAKYEAWVANGWKDGHDKKIKNWKSKIKNTIPHLRPSQTKSSPYQQQPGQKVVAPSMVTRERTGNYPT